jgi:hypothetical protein
MLSFNARIEDQAPVLKWSTASEVNNDYFFVQRSYDGQQYKNIAKVDGYGTTEEVNDYEFRDENALPGAIYYRLVQTDFDGTTETFGPVQVTLRSLSNGLVVYPNPVEDNRLNVQVYGLESGRSALIQVADLTGRTVYTENVEVSREEAIEVELQGLDQLRGGAYIVNVVQDNKRFSEKLIKL